MNGLALEKIGLKNKLEQTSFLSESNIFFVFLEGHFRPYFEILEVYSTKAKN